MNWQSLKRFRDSAINKAMSIRARGVAAMICPESESDQ